MTDEIEIVIRIDGKIFEGKLHSQTSTVNPPAFPEPYQQLLMIHEEGNSWILKPKEFLRKEDFSEIARIVRQYHGDYVSAGKSSYFKIPK